MGNSKSRIVENPLDREPDQSESSASVSVRVSKGLLSKDQYGDARSNSNTENEKVVSINKEKLQQAYDKGAEDCRKRMQAEFEEKLKSQKSLVTEDQEANERNRVKSMIDEINNRNFRAPIGVIHCGDEREACLQCYRSNLDDALKCKEVAEAFAECAQKHRDEYIKKSKK